MNIRLGNISMKNYRADIYGLGALIILSSKK